MERKNIEMISPYAFPGINVRDLDLSKYPYLDKSIPVLKLIDVAKVVSKVYGVTTEDLASPRRFRELVDARKTFCYAAKLGTGQTLKSIAGVIGNRDHTTIIHNANNFEELFENNEKFKKVATRALDILNLKYEKMSHKKYNRKRIKKNG
jgi:hypothetical protein